MKIESNELRKEINKLHSETGLVSKDEVKKIIDKLEEKTLSETEFYQILETL